VIPTSSVPFDETKYSVALMVGASSSIGAVGAWAVGVSVVACSGVVRLPDIMVTISQRASRSAAPPADTTSQMAQRFEAAAFFLRRGLIDRPGHGSAHRGESR